MSVEKHRDQLTRAAADLEALTARRTAAQQAWTAAIVADDQKAEVKTAKALSDIDAALSLAESKIAVVRRCLHDAEVADIPDRAVEALTEYRALADEAAELARDVMKHWREGHNRAQRIRELDGQCRAIAGEFHEHTRELGHYTPLTGARFPVELAELGRLYGQFQKFGAKWQPSVATLLPAKRARPVVEPVEPVEPETTETESEDTAA